MGNVLEQILPELEPVEEEFEFTRNDYKFVQWFMHKHAGIYLADSKRTMVYGRVSRKLREKALTRFCEYREIVEQDLYEQQIFINALTTNKTFFFREQHHFDYLESTLAPYWASRTKRAVRVWSAGCSTGEEPYSYLASLKHCGILESVPSVSLLATDLDSQVLDHAEASIYDFSALETIPPKYLSGNFCRGKGSCSGKIKVANTLREKVIFNQLNLLDSWPMQEKFDLISCRNVMIYFDRETQAKLLHRFYEQLTDDGVLFLGHSESIPSDNTLFTHLGNTIYVKSNQVQS